MTRPRALTRGLILVVDDQASTVRMLEDTPRTALILMTGDPDDRVEELARRAGAVGYLRKPFSFVELDETLARVMMQG
jgi:CheY-like chemotaxis protein